jgi:hypothetical protein
MYMTFNPNDDVLNVISEKIIGCAFNVSNRLGIGFVEKVYEMLWCMISAKLVWM